MTLCRDLSHPFVEELEQLVEDHHPNYLREQGQHQTELWARRLLSASGGMFSLKVGRVRVRGREGV